MHQQLTDKTDNVFRRDTPSKTGFIIPYVYSSFYTPCSTVFGLAANCSKELHAALILRR